MANNYFYVNSEDIAVFPCAFRGTDTNGNQINPEARLNTEYSLTRRHSSGKNSYIISYGGNLVRFVIGGYYFELKTTNCLDNIKGKTAVIKISSDKADSNAYLKNLETNTITTLDSEWKFKGLGFTNEQETESSTLFALKLFDDDKNIVKSSCLQYRAEDSYYGIESNLIGKTITGNFVSDYSTTGVTSAVVQLNNGVKNNSATANNTIALGDHTKADKENLVAIGKYNATETGDLFVVGNGSEGTTEDPDKNRSNVLEVNKDKVVSNKIVEIYNPNSSSNTESLHIYEDDGSSTSVVVDNKGALRATASLTVGDGTTNPFIADKNGITTTKVNNVEITNATSSQETKTITVEANLIVGNRNKTGQVSINSNGTGNTAIYGPDGGAITLPENMPQSDPDKTYVFSQYIDKNWNSVMAKMTEYKANAGAANGSSSIVYRDTNGSFGTAGTITSNKVETKGDGAIIKSPTIQASGSFQLTDSNGPTISYDSTNKCIKIVFKN